MKHHQFYNVCVSNVLALMRSDCWVCVKTPLVIDWSLDLFFFGTVNQSALKALKASYGPS